MQRVVLRRSGLAILIFLAIGVAELFAQVANGGFESNGGAGTTIFTSWTVADQPGGTGSWYVQTGTASPLNAFLVAAPTEGSFAAMTDQPGPGSHILYQNIAVPATGGTLTFDIFIQTFAPFANPSPETLDFTVSPNQHARVDIMTTASAVTDVGAGVLQNVFLTNPGDPLTSGYNTISVPLAPFAGQTVRLRFAEVDNQLFFNAGIDNVQLSACMFAGTPGQRNCHGKSVSALSNQFEDLDAAALALGYPSVSALQNAIRACCEACGPTGIRMCGGTCPNAGDVCVVRPDDGGCECRPATPGCVETDCTCNNGSAINCAYHATCADPQADPAVLCPQSCAGAGGWTGQGTCGAPSSAVCTGDLNCVP
jgi:hypothetical protein